MRWTRKRHKWGPPEWHDSTGHPGCRYEYRTCERCGEKGYVLTVDIYGSVYAQ